MLPLLWTCWLCSGHHCPHCLQKGHSVVRSNNNKGFILRDFHQNYHLGLSLSQINLCNNWVFFLLLLFSFNSSDQLSKTLTDLLYYAYVWIHQVRILVFDNHQMCPAPLTTLIITTLLISRHFLKDTKHQIFTAYFLSLKTISHTDICMIIILSR